MITVEELYEVYIDASRRCLTSTSEQSDEIMAYDIFEEFDVGAYSYFTDEALQRLYDAGMIGDDAFVLSQRIRQFWLDLDPYSFELGEIRQHPKWKQLFSMCDELHAILSRNSK